MAGIISRPFSGLAWLLSRGISLPFTLLGLSNAARTPVAPRGTASLLQLSPEKGAVVTSASLCAAGPVCVLVLRRPG